MRKLNKITILIPCFNEEKGIKKVIDGIPYKKLNKFGYSVEIIVIDNNSTDKTAENAKQKGALVIREEKIGKGNAIRTGFRAVSADSKFVVMVDGDNTYKLNETYRLIELLESNFCDVVLGSRLSGKINKSSLKFQNRIVNWTFTFLVRHIYKANVTDVLSGYFAWKRDVIRRLVPHLESDGFAIEMEMITKIVKLGYSAYSVPITYDTREGETKIKSVRDGLIILWALIKYTFWRPQNINSINKPFGVEEENISY